MDTPAHHSLIIDVGKTTIKCHLLDSEGHSVKSASMANTVVDSPPYPHFDTEHTWDWLLETISALDNKSSIVAINVTTHGACAALLDGASELALPILDYEYTGPDACRKEYDAIRPPFKQTLSPDLPAGLNLGRQLYWQKQTFPEQFATVAQVLLYPQYWVWRLCGNAVTEVTSLGCHTDLWLPEKQRLSKLASTLGIADAFPAVKPAWNIAGTLRQEIAEATDLSPDCAVYAGVHDSNGSLARHLYSTLDHAPTVVSTGTWVITMSANGATRGLREELDTLANVSVLGKPLPSARFMGGREFEEICRLAQADTGSTTDNTTNKNVKPRDIQELLQSNVFALPCFASAGGPFRNRVGELRGQPRSGEALGTLYLALMIDYQLELLDASGDIIFGSYSHKNPMLCRLLAQLRPGQRILLSGDEASTVTGAWCLTRWQEPPPGHLTHYDTAQATSLAGLAAYRKAWRQQCGLPR